MALSKFETLWRIMINYRLEIDGETPSGVICAICSKLMIEPYAAECGCQFCSVCIKDYLQDGGKKCPVCNDGCCEESLVIDVNVFKDVRANHIIKKVSVKCPYTRCTFSTELEKMEDHISSCPLKPIVCPFFSIGCVNEVTVVESIDEHVLHDITPHSQMLIDTIKEMRASMQEMKEEIKNNTREMDALKAEAQKKEILFETMGRKIEELIEKISNDTKTSDMFPITEHVSFDYFKLEIARNTKEIDDIKEDSRKNKTLIENINKDIHHIKEECSRLRQNVTGLEGNSTMLNVLPQMKSDELMGSEGLSKYNCETSTTNHTMIKTTEEMTDENQSKKSIDADHRSEIIDYPKHHFIWTIEDFSKKVMDTTNRLHFSSPFYKDNYKFCLGVQISELPELKSNLYLELYIVIMKGDLDYMAKWPMRNTIELSIVNQINMSSYKVGQYSYDKQKGPKYNFDKPMKSMNDFIGGLSIAIKDINSTPGLLLKDMVMVAFSLHPISPSLD